MRIPPAIRPTMEPRCCRSQHADTRAVFLLFLPSIVLSFSLPCQRCCKQLIPARPLHCSTPLWASMKIRMALVAGGSFALGYLVCLMFGDRRDREEDEKWVKLSKVCILPTLSPLPSVPPPPA